MLYTLKPDGKYYDESGNKFSGVIPRDINVGDQYQDINLENGQLETCEVIEKTVNEDGSIILRTRIVG